MSTLKHSNHWYPAANPDKQPSPWWYFGRAVYVSRRDYRKIFLAFVSIGIPLGILGLIWTKEFLYAAYFMAAVGLFLFFYSLFGLYRMYGHPSRQYLERLFEFGKVSGSLVIADLHIGTYRHAYSCADVLPEAKIYSVDCWNVDGESSEEAIQDVRDLEPPPTSHPRIFPLRAEGFQVPLPDASCDVVLFGFGTHEIPQDGPRKKIFCEARRVLKPKGKVLLFEHGYDFHNYLIFGPVIGHVTKRKDWLNFMKDYFDDVNYCRTSQAVDLFVGTHHGR
jgi:SAM-dependent methyltransferase